MSMWRGVIAVGAVVAGCVGGGGQALRPSDSHPDTDEGPETVARLKSFVPPAPEAAGGWNSNVPQSLVGAGDRLYFALNVNDGRHCCALWTSDSTPEGTVEVKTFDPKVDVNPFVRQLTPVGDQVFFVAEGEGANSVNTGNDLWVSDGTSSGTRLLKAIAQAPPKGSSELPDHRLVALGKSLLFFQYLPATATTAEHVELWKSDGTPPGTVRVKDLGSNTVVGPSFVAGNTVYFTSSDPVHGAELWKSDGTDSGTQLVLDIVPGAEGSQPSDFRTDGTNLYFTATVKSHQTLWKSDGGSAGTVLVAPLDEDATEAAMKPLALAGDTLYLSAVNKDHFIRLYGMDLGSEGPVRRQLLATLPNPKAQDARSAGDPSLTNFAASGGKLYFSQSIPSGHPAPEEVQFWVSDGTQTGTQLLLHPMSRSDEFTGGLTVPRAFTPVGNAMFFIAYEPEHGNSLWVFKPWS